MKSHIASPLESFVFSSEKILWIESIFCPFNQCFSLFLSVWPWLLLSFFLGGVSSLCHNQDRLSVYVRQSLISHHLSTYLLYINYFHWEFLLHLSFQDQAVIWDILYPILSSLWTLLFSQGFPCISFSVSYHVSVSLRKVCCPHLLTIFDHPSYTTTETPFEPSVQICKLFYFSLDFALACHIYPDTQLQGSLGSSICLKFS